MHIIWYVRMFGVLYEKKLYTSSLRSISDLLCNMYILWHALRCDEIKIVQWAFLLWIQQNIHILRDITEIFKSSFWVPGLEGQSLSAWHKKKMFPSKILGRIRVISSSQAKDRCPQMLLLLSRLFECLKPGFTFSNHALSVT